MYCNYVNIITVLIFPLNHFVIYYSTLPSLNQLRYIQLPESFMFAVERLKVMVYRNLRWVKTGFKSNENYDGSIVVSSLMKFTLGQTWFQGIALSYLFSRGIFIVI